MRKLYVKIFIVIWFMMLATAGILVGVSAQIRGFSEDPDVAQRSNKRFQSLVNDVRSILLQNGEDGLVSFLGEFQNNVIDLPMFLYYQKKEQLVFGDLPSTDMFGRMQLAHLEGISDLREFDWTWRFVEIQDVDSNRYMFAVRSPDISVLQTAAARLLFQTRYAVAALLLAVLMTGGISYLLALYLTGPLRQLEQAGRALADGDFSIRVQKKLGQRDDESGELAFAFDHMAERVEDLVASHRLLLRDVSHELRSPLARVQAALSLARQRTDGLIDKELDRVEKEMELLDQMIGNLLKWSRMDAKQQSISNDVVELNTLLAEIVSAANFEAKVQNKMIELHMCDELSVYGDAELLGSAIENIVRNAMRYTPEDSSIKVSVAVDDQINGWLSISIRDHGPGVPEQELTRIFEPFYRVGESRVRTKGGSGIGLAIARQAVGLHGGQVFAENAGSGGLMVTLRLPTSRLVS
jgi:two-component system sensor histidine kinase CpxA